MKFDEIVISNGWVVKFRHHYVTEKTDFFDSGEEQ